MPKLIWKEWHEQSWKLGFGCLVLGAMALIGLRARIIPDASMILWVCLLGMAILPVLSSTGLIPAERSEGSFESLLALPVARWRILAAKTVMGLALCIGPMLTAAVASVLVAGGREESTGQILALYACSTGSAIFLFAWMMALTVRLPNEARAGLLAVGVLIFWLIATVGLADLSSPWPALTISPLALADLFVDHFLVLQWIAVLPVQLAFATALWVWTNWQMSGTVEGQR